MTNKEIERLIASRLTGEATTQERSRLRLWLNSNDKNKEEYSKIALVYQLSKDHTSHNRKAQILSNISKRIDADENNRIQGQQKQVNRFIKTWVSVAASLLIVLSVGVLYFSHTFNINKQTELVAQTITKSNPAGQKSKVFLPDGSIVWLNSESTINYENEFNDSCRHVKLTGEAYFEVMKDASRPFVVYSGSISTTALGTAFNINAFNEQNITVSLTEGKVNVQTTVDTGKARSLTINPGEGVLYNPSNENTINVIDINPREVKMWKDGLLLLDHATLKETITRLERWYGVDIVLNNDPYQKWDAKGTFANEYLDNVLNALSFSQNFEYEIQRKKVYITFKQKMPM